MTEADPGLERLTNLTFALLNADKLGRQFLTYAWIHHNVDGYKSLASSAADKAIMRDLRLLKKAGVPLETLDTTEPLATKPVKAVRLSKDDYALPEVSFTPEEATVLALAGDVGMEKELATFARSGWTKLAAAGATRDFGHSSAVATVGDIRTISGQALDIILSACSKHQLIQFQYRPGQEDDTHIRTMAPWGLVPLRSRLYLVGFDLDRDAIRCFRINRISDIHAVRTQSSHLPPEGINLQEEVEKSLRRGRALIDAVVAITPGKARDIADMGQPITNYDDAPAGMTTYQLTGVDTQWLVRTLTSLAPDAIVLEPADIRQAIIDRLRAVVENHQEVRRG